MTDTNTGDQLSENEKFYDEVIAPQILAIGQQCKDRNMSFAAEVEWVPGESGSTTNLTEDSSVAMFIVAAAMKAHGNIDALITTVSRYAHTHGHSSICLKTLGVPTSPDEPTPTEAQ